MEAPDFLSDAQKFTSALNHEYYQSRAGRKASLDITPIYEAHVPLFEGDRFAEAARWDLDPREVRYIQAFIAHGYVLNSARALEERAAAIEAGSTVDWDEAAVPYRQVQGMINNEPDAGRRHALEERYLAVMATLNPTLEEAVANKHRAARQFGHADYVEMYDDLRGLQLKALTETMQRFLASTREPYFAALDTYLHEMHILRDDARRCDVARIFRAPQYDLAFPSDAMLGKLNSTLRDLGIRLEDQPNIRVDAASRPLKSPRAFCAMVQVPDDVRLVVKPSGGEQDYESLFHEAGHAEHYGNVDRTQPFAYRCLGDASVTESYAFLLEYLLHNPEWLDRHLPQANSEGFAHLAGFHRLYMLRRYATKLIYEWELHQAGQPNDVAPYYDELMAEHLGLTYGSESYLTDVDEGFYSAAYLRAWIFEAQHRRYLQGEFGSDWFRNEKAGKFLVELWREGQKHTVEELAGFMGYPGLDATFVEEDVTALLQGL
jgi:hypothetical protein